ncbi:hypothetical protein GCM10007169_06030 [Shewanella fodinae]|nr:hypothetical protein GCM10007169_06030 [Shewanella fodinae]
MFTAVTVTAGIDMVSALLAAACCDISEITVGAPTAKAIAVMAVRYRRLVIKAMGFIVFLSQTDNSYPAVGAYCRQR